VVFPLVSFAEPEDFGPLDASLGEMQQFDWMILTSATSSSRSGKARREFEAEPDSGGQQVANWLCRSSDGEAARHAGFRVDMLRRRTPGAALAAELGQRLQGQSILAAKRSRKSRFATALAAARRGAYEVVAYRTAAQPRS